MCSGGMYETITSEGRIVWVCYRRYFDKATYIPTYIGGWKDTPEGRLGGGFG